MTDQTDKDTRQKFLMLTGPSGAGRSTAIRALEDLGYEVIDNLPLSLLPNLVNGPAPARSVAVGIDVRNRDFDAAYVCDLHRELMQRDDLDAQMLYLDCDDDVLLRRFSETRRRHPLTSADSPVAGIQLEKELLAPIRRVAEYLIDSTDMTVHGLRAEIDRMFAPRDGRFMAIQVQSFSYKRGLPRGLDLAFDVRFLRNPHWVDELRPLDGRDARVSGYVAQDPLYAPFFKQVQDMAHLLLPAYKKEGKAHLSIGFGCTGGKHRSVTLAEALSKTLAEDGWQVATRHRELERNAHMQAENRTR